MCCSSALYMAGQVTWLCFSVHSLQIWMGPWAPQGWPPLWSTLASSMFVREMKSTWSLVYSSVHWNLPFRATSRNKTFPRALLVIREAGVENGLEGLVDLKVFTVSKLGVPFYSVGIFRTSSQGDSISSNPERTDPRRWGEEAGYIDFCNKGSQNIKEKTIFQGKCFSVYGKTQGSLKSFLWYVHAKWLQSPISAFLVAQSCLTLCNPMDCSPPSSFVHGFSRQEYWSGLPRLSPGDLPDPGIEPTSPTLWADSLLSEPPEKPSSLLGNAKYHFTLKVSKARVGWSLCAATNSRGYNRRSPRNSVEGPVMWPLTFSNQSPNLLISTPKMDKDHQTELSELL